MSWIERGSSIDADAEQGEGAMGIEARQSVRAEVGARANGKLLSLGAIAGVVVFVLGWLVVGAVEGGGYSAASDDISDLGALTAHHPALALATQAICGVLVIAFALLGLRPALAIPGRRAAIGPWLVAGSLIGLDNVGDAFFRLDCRAADAGCSVTKATASVHGKLHIAVGVFAALMTAAAPFFLARRMRVLDAWRDLARPAVVFGVVLLGLLVTYAALERASVGGYVQRSAAVLVAGGVIALAARTIRAGTQPEVPR